jgi:predicted RND superfamily exporter protein
MVEMSIGKKVNTLTVLALGVGVGVDYAIYIFARMREAMQQGKPLTESYFIALKTTGIAVFYTALTLAVGVGLWIFSDLKFQADMGVLLTFMFVVNMIAAIVFLPALPLAVAATRARHDISGGDFSGTGVRFHRRFAFM